MSADAMPVLPAVADLLEAGRREGVAPALAAAVLVRGELVHASWHGHAQLEPSVRPLAPGDLFDIASLTKVVATTTLAARLVDQGGLALEARLGELLPGVRDPGLARVTAEQLLTHTSGLTWWRPYFETIAADPDTAPLFAAPDERPRELWPLIGEARRRLRAAVTTEPLEAEPGVRALYSDPGFLLLGWAVERAGGAPLDVQLREQVAGPLGLADTFYIREDDAAAAARARAERRFVATERCEHRREVNCGAVNDDNAWALGGVAGHAGVFSTPLDVARVGQSWLDALHDRPALVSAATARRFATRTGPAESTRALGWDTPCAEGSSLGSRLGRGPRGAIGHLGFTGTSLWIDLDAEVVCTLFTNRVHPTRANEALRAFRPRFHDAVAAAIVGLINYR